MIVLYILLAILGLLVLLLLIPVQIGLQYQRDLTVWMRYGMIKWRLYPQKKNAETSTSKHAAAAKSRKSQKRKKTSTLSDKWAEIADNMKRDSLAETLEQIKELMTIIGRTTRHLLRSLTIDRLHLGLLVAAGEADATAIRYGQACAVIFPAVTTVNETMRVKDRRVVIHPGFGREDSLAVVDIRIHAVPLRLLIVALGALCGIIQWTDSIALQENEKG